MIFWFTSARSAWYSFALSSRQLAWESINDQPARSQAHLFGRAFDRTSRRAYLNSDAPNFPQKVLTQAKLRVRVKVCSARGSIKCPAEKVSLGPVTMSHRSEDQTNFGSPIARAKICPEDRYNRFLQGFTAGLSPSQLQIVRQTKPKTARIDWFREIDQGPGATDWPLAKCTFLYTNVHETWRQSANFPGQPTLIDFTKSIRGRECPTDHESRAPKSAKAHKTGSNSCAKRRTRVFERPNFSV